MDEKYGIIVPRYRTRADHFVPGYEMNSIGEEEHFEARHIVMAVTDWQLWLHILLAWSIVAPSKSRFLSSSGRRLINMAQFTGFPSSCRRSSEGSDIRFQFQTSLPSLRMFSPVSFDQFGVFPGQLMIIIAFFSNRLVAFFSSCG